MNTNAMTLFEKKNVSSVFGTDLPTTNNLSAGIAASYGFMRYKGKVWTLSYRGEDMPLMRSDGDGPRNSIEVVVLAASPGISKTFYEEAFAEGANAPPDCSSINGIVPNPSSPKKQAKTCAACPNNVWGSRVTPAGKAAKACQDNKRLVIVPLQDIPNEAYGGPLLLRVPPTSLQDLAQHGDRMHQQGYPSYTYGTRIAFDANSPHPKFLFEPIRPLTDDEARQVLSIKDLPVINRILNDTTEVGETVSYGEAPEWENKTQAQTTQSNPSTGATSTQSAPPAEKTTPTSQGQTLQSPPASASPQPMPTPPEAKTATTRQGGFATTANTGRTNGSGFGADPSTNPSTSQTTPTMNTTTPTMTTMPTEGDKPQINTNPENRVNPEEQAAAFEKGLDDMVAKLLPK